jgi:sterol 3beta-glucosyltransferase
MLGAYSPSVIPHPPDWPDSVHITGYLFLESGSDWTPPPDLDRFLAMGDPPVYIGFGSMAGRSPEELAELIAEAIAKSGQRGLLLKGWGGLKPEWVPDEVYVAESVPHSWLFPRVSAVVHHGGAGTTAEGLRTGAPTVIVPFAFDQAFWGRRVRALGAGTDPLPLKRLSADRLAEAIMTAVSDPQIRHRARSCGQAIRAEDGVGDAVRVIEGYLAKSQQGERKSGR